MDFDIYEIKNEVVKRINPGMAISDEALMDSIDEVLMLPQHRFTDYKSKRAASKEVFNSIRKLDVLSELLEDDSITEIMVNGLSNIYVERGGRLMKTSLKFKDAQALGDVIQRIAARSNKIVNEASPIIDTRLEDGSRVNIVLSPITPDGSVITIRKFYDTPLDMEKLLEYKSLPKVLADFLKLLVEGGYNIFISGGTGTGKTTFLNALSNYIPKNERVITIEDSCELKLNGVENLVRMEARNANNEGKNGITIRDMIRASLRMRPDRLIIGEVRGGEALDMLQGLNSGHEGSLSTGHSNGPAEMLLRLETMVLMAVDMPVPAIRSQIASALDIIVHLARFKDGSRRVVSVCEVEGIEEKNGSCNIKLNTIYDYQEQLTGRYDNATVETFKNKLVHREKLTR